jgi:flagellin-specific chaperone FliS
MENRIMCYDCKNHASHEMKCMIDHPNYKKKGEIDLSECYIKNKLHESMDRMEDILNRMSEILDKRNG